MDFKIFDVEHGFCGYLVADNGNVALFDCGHNSTTGFYPAHYLMRQGCSGIERFFVSNYDEDHLSGLPELRKNESNLPIQVLSRNVSITRDQLRSLKEENGGIGSGVESLLEMLGNYTQGVSVLPDFAGVEFKTFSCPYPKFDDTNNLSLVTFFKYESLCVVYPGDIEKDGWDYLLLNEEFRNWMAKVTIFIASHHGRESGYNPRVFEYCKPQIIILSDDNIQYETQEVDYAKHASGINYGGERRYVFTTRCDGMITLNKMKGSAPTINTSK